MNLPILAAFLSNGLPDNSLSPTININRVNANDGAFISEVSDGAMTLKADGVYSYNFGNLNPLYDYAFTMPSNGSNDNKVVYASYSGIQALIDLIPRGGGGGSSFTASHLDSITKALETRITELFGQFEIEVPEVIFDTSEIKDLIKQAKLDSGKTSKEFSALIDKAAKKVEEIKSPKITTESVNTSQMEASIISKLKSNLEPIMKRGGDTIDDLLGDFAKWMMAETKKQVEGDRVSIRAEERESLVQEFKNSLK